MYITSATTPIVTLNSPNSFSEDYENEVTCIADSRQQCEVHKGNFCAQWLLAAVLPNPNKIYI